MDRKEKISMLAYAIKKSKDELKDFADLIINNPGIYKTADDMLAILNLRMQILDILFEQKIEEAKNFVD